MTWIEAGYFVKMPSGPPAQGDIWTALPCVFPEPIQCMGIIITPRCDLSHDKTPVVNYLPILSLDKYMAVQGGHSLVGQEISRCQDALRNAAGPLKMLELLELGIAPERLVELAASDMEGEMDTRARDRAVQQLNAFRGYADKINLLKSRLETSTLTLQELNSLVSEKAIRRYKLEIVRNTIIDLHFIPPCHPLMEDPSVILLRYATSCSTVLLNAAGTCINQDQWERMREITALPNSAECRLKPERLARLKSPYFECLMARFAALYGRVGVRDFDQGQLEAFVTARS
jgi:hypothetical protein